MSANRFANKLSILLLPQHALLYFLYKATFADIILTQIFVTTKIMVYSSVKIITAMD